MANFNTNIPLGSLWVGGHGAASGATLVMDTDYEFLTGGEAIGVKFIAPTGGVTIDKVWAAIANKTGTPTLTCDIALGGTIDHPSSALTGDFATSNASSWIEFTNFQPTQDPMIGGGVYWVSIGTDAGSGLSSYEIVSDGGPTNFGLSPSKIWEAYRTASGWSGASTALSSPPIVIKFSDGTYMGNPFDTTTTTASNTHHKGWVITPQVDLVLLGASLTTFSANITDIAVYLNGKAPDATPDAVSTSDSMSAANLTAFFEDEVTLTAGQTHRIVFRYGVNTAMTVYSNTYGSTATSTRNANPWGGTVYYVSGTGSTWTGNQDQLPVGAMYFRSSGAAGSTSTGITPSRPAGRPAGRVR